MSTPVHLHEHLDRNPGDKEGLVSSYGFMATFHGLNVVARVGWALCHSSAETSDPTYQDVQQITDNTVPLGVI